LLPGNLILAEFEDAGHLSRISSCYRHMPMHKWSKPACVSQFPPDFSYLWTENLSLKFGSSIHQA